MYSRISDIINNSSFTVDDKCEKVTQLLNSLPNRGVSECVQFILNCTVPAAATYPANYLALLPNFLPEKQQIVEHIINQQPLLMIAATNLIKDMPDNIIDQLIDEYFQDTSSSDMYSIIYEIAQYFPEKLHTFVHLIDDEYLSKAILPGGADSWVDALFKQYLENKDPSLLEDLAYFRTDKALDALITLIPEVPEEDLENLHAYIEASGVCPETRFASIYFKYYRGYIVSGGESPHHMGGNFPHPVPKCPVTDKPATRIFTLDASQLDLGLKSGYNPSFFWYESSYQPYCIYVQFTENGLQGLMTPMTDGEVGTEIIPGELALLLVEQPVKFGVGSTAISGFSHYQVGGYPRFIRFERFPCCPLCSHRMKFLVSLDSGMTPFGILNFQGIFYGFWCDDCAVSCSIVQYDY